MDEEVDIAALIPAIAALMHAVNARQRQIVRASRPTAAAARLHPQTLAVLFAIPRDGGIRQDELARQLGLSPSDADYATGALRDASLVSERRARDRRKVDLLLTDEGAALVDAHHAQMRPPVVAGDVPRTEVSIKKTIELLDSLTAELRDQAAVDARKEQKK